MKTFPALGYAVLSVEGERVTGTRLFLDLENAQVAFGALRDEARGLTDYRLVRLDGVEVVKCEVSP